jgi:hypothetical protein
MGVPEMEKLFNYLARGKEAGTLDPEEEKLARKFFKTLDLLASNPRHNSLASHEIDELTKRVGFKVFQSYLENRTPAAGRLFWAYGPDSAQITVLGLEPHPENTKHGYAGIRLSRSPP